MPLLEETSAMQGCGAGTTALCTSPDKSLTKNKQKYERCTIENRTGEKKVRSS